VIDTNSDAWREVAKFVSARVQKVTAELIASGKTEMQYENYRGQLKALQMVIELGKRPDDRPQSTR